MKKLLSLLNVFLLIPAVTFAGSISASIDNPQVPYGEMFNLAIVYEGDDDNALAPDLSVLQNDFIIYSTSSSLQSTYINGKGSQIRRWDIGLMPQKEGKLTIPEISAGQYKTDPITVEIMPAGSTIEVKNDNNTTNVKPAEFDINLEVENKDIFVQQQINAILTIKDNRGLNFENMPTFGDSDDWIIKSLSKPTVEEKNGERIIKFYYALFPQKSGKLQIPSATANAYYISYESAPANRNGGFFKMFDMNLDFGGLFGVNKPVRLATKPQNINVKPALADSGEWWLPAKKLAVIAEWSDKKPSFKLGETVAREVTITASGVADTQLPELKFSENQAWKQYPEKPQYSSIVHDNEIISQAVTRIVYIPQQSGEVEIPEIIVPWYNTEKKQMEKAIVPAEKIYVSGTSTQAFSADNAPKKANVIDQQPKQLPHDNLIKQTVSDVKSGMLNWLIIFSAFVAGLFLSYVLFGRKREAKEKITTSAYLSKIEKNLSAKDYRALRDNLLYYAQEIYPTAKINNLNDLALMIKDSPFSEQMQLLNRILYADTIADLDDKIILSALKNLKKRQSEEKKENPLPNLYR